MTKRTISVLIFLLAVGTYSHAQINLNKVKNKANAAKNKSKSKSNSKTKTESDTKTNSGSSSEKSTNSSTNSSTGKTNAASSATSESSAAPGLATYASYYDLKRQFIDRNLGNAGNRKWTDDFLDELEQFDVPGTEAKMKEDADQCGDFLMLYPKKLPTSGMGAITQQNVGEYTFANVADANAEPPASDDGKKILRFYNKYCLFKQELVKGKGSIATMLRTSIQEADNAHPRQKFNNAKLAKRQAEMAVLLLPDDMRIADLKEEADQLYRTTISAFGNMISGDFHANHLQEVVVFGKNPSFGSESDADVLDVIIPGEEAYVTGYFAMTNKTAGGIPSLLFINPEDKYAKDQDPWGHGTESLAPMFNGQSVKEVYYEKAYFCFNLFPKIESINYESHVQYIPHLNIVKWLMYLPSEVVDIPIRYGRSEKVAVGRVKVDLSGDNKAKLKAYFEALNKKRLAAVTFPDLAGCSESRSKVRNFSDLAKYGKVLKLSMTQTGDIMKPWPNDDEVDFNTAAGYAAVEKSDGRVEIMPLDFRKKPTESDWQWWSVGSFPGLYPLQDMGTQINAVKKLEHGYEILPTNVGSCGYWYDQQ